MTEDRGPPLSEILTSWGMVRRMFAPDSGERSTAWRDFHETYRPSIVAYVRRFLSRVGGKDVGPEASEEVAQAFVVEAFEKQSLSRADPERGRFRAYLQGALHHFCCDWLDHGHALRRSPGPGRRVVPIDHLVERGAEPGSSADEAAEAFDRAWAAGVVRLSLESLRRADADAASRIDDLVGVTPASTAAPSAALTSTDRSRRHRALERLRVHFAAVLATTVSRQELRNDEWRSLAPYLPADLTPP